MQNSKSGSSLRKKELSPWNCVKRDHGHTSPRESQSRGGPWNSNSKGKLDLPLHEVIQMDRSRYGGSQGYGSQGNTGYGVKRAERLEGRDRRNPAGSHRRGGGYYSAPRHPKTEKMPLKTHRDFSYAPRGPVPPYKKPPCDCGKGPKRPGGNHHHQHQYRRKKNMLTAEDSAVLKCVEVEDELEYKVRYEETDVVVVKKSNGEMHITSGGWRTISTLGVLNACLRPLNMAVNIEGQDVATSTWTLRAFSSQGRRHRTSLNGAVAVRAQPFSDSMEVRLFTGSSALMVGRTSIIQQYLQQMRLTIKCRLSLGTPQKEIEVPEGYFFETQRS